MAIIQDWKIRSRATHCCYSGEPFEDGEIFYTCIFEIPGTEDFARRDYSARNWDLILKNLDPPPFSFWKSTFEVPQKDTEPEPIEHHSAESMLRSMIDEDDPRTENARYILALMLERKKTLKPVDEKETETRRLLFYEHKVSGDLFIVADPGLKLDQIAAVQEEVSALLRGDGPSAGDDAKEAAPDAEDDSPADGDANSPGEDENQGPNEDSELRFEAQSVYDEENPDASAMPDEPIQNESLKSLKGQIDELIVQLSLGKSEAADFVEEKKAELRALLDRVSPGAPEQLREKLDTLGVQLELGKMESRDSLESQREKIHHSIEEAKTEWHRAEAGLKDKLEEATESLKTKLDALAFELSVRHEVAREEIDLEKEKTRTRLRDLQQDLRDAVENTEQNVESLVKDSRIAFEDVKDNLRRLLGRT